MDFQYFGANCISISYKSTRIVIDDDLNVHGKKNILKPGDVALFTSKNNNFKESGLKINIDCPGDYEVEDVSIKGIQARSHIDEPSQTKAVMYRISMMDINILATGHIYPELNQETIEQIGLCDVLILPIGGNGYTLDPKGALEVIKEIEPKLVIPTHYQEKGITYNTPQITLADALKEMAMEPKETVSKLKLKSTDLSDTTQLVVLEIS